MQRKEFNTRIVKFAMKLNNSRDIEDYFTYKYDSNRGGWDSLNYLVDKNIVNNLYEYFEIIKLSNEKLYFKEPKEVIEIIKTAGGYPFLAHPSSYAKDQLIKVNRF